MKFNVFTAVILCGGKGTRLYPITKKFPNLSICFGKPFIYFLIEQLISFKIKKNNFSYRI